MSMFGCDSTRFSYKDFYADIDAYNLSKLINRNTTLTEALYIYYTEGYKNRFKSFTSNRSKFGIGVVVGEYTSQAMYGPSIFGANDWPLTKGYDFSSEFRDAIKDVFTDILWQHVLEERERNK